MILSLDTAVIVDSLRRRSSPVRDRLAQALRDGFKPVVSSLVLHELVLGSWLNPDPSVERARVEQTLLGIEVMEFAAEDAEATGRLGALLRRSGRSIGDIDTLIAGQALARGWTVVTSNIKHFGRVEGLSLIDWATGFDPLSETDIAARLNEG